MVFYGAGLSGAACFPNSEGESLREGGNTLHCWATPACPRLGGRSSLINEWFFPWGVIPMYLMKVKVRVLQLNIQLIQQMHTYCVKLCVGTPQEGNQLQ